MTVHRFIAVFCAVACAASTGTRRAAAQHGDAGRAEVFAGSTLESYLRYLHTLSPTGDYPVSIRSFSAREIARLTPSDTLHPWARRYFKLSERRTVALPMSVSTFANTSFPFGGNDGPVWKGRGLTGSVSSGLVTRWKSVAAVFAPLAFVSQNASIALMPNGQTGRLSFANGRFPLSVDKPQTFGDGAYARFDPGESTLRLDFRALAAGVSTAGQWWGPTSEFPVVLGNNAGGFPHAFVGTARPVGPGGLRVHGRVVYGFLEQSDYSPVTGADEFVDFTETGTRRFMAGIIALVQIGGLKGWELGGSRFFHAGNTGGVSAHNLRLPLQGFFKAGLPPEADTVFDNDRAVRENQIASVFLRVAPPGSGLELYVEHGREDHSTDLYDYLLEPEHSSLTTTGFRKAWLTPRGLTAVRGEALSYEFPSGVRIRPLGNAGAYTHSVLRQGHTHRGQLLASDVGPGSGNAQILVVERFTQSGRTAAFFRRAVTHESAEEYAGGDAIRDTPDVMNTLGAEVMRFRGSLDIILNASLTVELNRNLEFDKTNAGVGIVFRRAWR
ncbi:MAG TPA: capsule assembly Wzi family protein [Gemmatimonadaceae bacterium]